MEPRSASRELSSSWLVGVQLPTSSPASRVSRSTLSPQAVFPSYGAFPVATRIRPLPGSTTAPARAQIAASDSGQLDGSMISSRSEQSAFQTWTIRPLARSIETTWPW